MKNEHMKIEKTCMLIPGLFLICLFYNRELIGQGVAVNSQGQLPDASAQLDISSVSRGLLIPRLTTEQKMQITNPAKALLIFNTSTNHFEVNTGSPENPIWSAVVMLQQEEIKSGFWKNGGNYLSENDGVLGAKNASSLSIITNNITRIFFDSTDSRVGIHTQHPKSSLHIDATDAIILPSGTTAQRPVAPVPGMIRFNKETGKLEGYTSEGWKNLQ
jgi:hypothetical protein